MTRTPPPLPASAPSRPTEGDHTRAVTAQVIPALREDTIWLGIGRQLSNSTMLTAWMVTLKAGPLAIGLLGTTPFIARVVKFIVQPLVFTKGAAKLVWPLALCERLGIAIAVLGGLLPDRWLTVRTLAVLLGITCAAVAGALYDQALQDSLAQAEAATDTPHLLVTGVGERTRWLAWAAMGASLLIGVALDSVERHAWVSPTTARMTALSIGLVCASIGLIGTRRLRRVLRDLAAAAAPLATPPSSPMPPTPAPAGLRARVSAASQRILAVLFPQDRLQRLWQASPQERQVFLFALGWGMSYGLVLRHIDVATLNIMGLTLGVLTMTLALTAATQAISAPWWVRLARRSHRGAMVAVTIAGLAVSTAMDTVALALDVPWILFLSRALVGVFSVGWTIALPIWLQEADLRAESPRGRVHTREERLTLAADLSQRTALYWALYGTGAALGPLFGGLVLRSLQSLTPEIRYGALFALATGLRFLCAYEMGRRFGEPDDPWAMAVWRRAIHKMRVKSALLSWPGSRGSLSE